MLASGGHFVGRSSGCGTLSDGISITRPQALQTFSFTLFNCETFTLKSHVMLTETCVKKTPLIQTFYLFVTFQMMLQKYSLV